MHFLPWNRIDYFILGRQTRKVDLWLLWRWESFTFHVLNTRISPIEFTYYSTWSQSFGVHNPRQEVINKIIITNIRSTRSASKKQDVTRGCYDKFSYHPKKVPRWKLRGVKRSIIRCRCNVCFSMLFRLVISQSNSEVLCSGVTPPKR